MFCLSRSWGIKAGYQSMWPPAQWLAAPHPSGQVALENSPFLYFARAFHFQPHWLGRMKAGQLQEWSGGQAWSLCALFLSVLHWWELRVMVPSGSWEMESSSVSSTEIALFDIFLMFYQLWWATIEPLWEFSELFYYLIVFSGEEIKPKRCHAEVTGGRWFDFRMSGHTQHTNTAHNTHTVFTQHITHTHPKENLQLQADHLVYCVLSAVMSVSQHHNIPFLLPCTKTTL